MPDRKQLEADHPEAEVQTDKESAKLLACRECNAELITSAFYSSKNALCTDCKGEVKVGGTATVGAPVPGKTAPHLARDLADCLIHKTWAEFACPADPAHGDMELKMVSHNEHYGPCQVVGVKDGKPVYRNETGESAMHQCNVCKATLSLSTTAQSVFRRQNEIADHRKTGSFYETALGVRAS